MVSFGSACDFGATTCDPNVLFYSRRRLRSFGFAARRLLRFRTPPLSARRRRALRRKIRRERKWTVQVRAEHKSADADWRRRKVWRKFWVVWADDGIPTKTNVTKCFWRSGITILTKTRGATGSLQVIFAT